MKARSCRVAQRRAPRAESAWDTELADARARVGQGPVKVEEAPPVPHVSIMTGQRPGGRLDSQGANRAQRGTGSSVSSRAYLLEGHPPIVVTANVPHRQLDY